MIRLRQQGDQQRLDLQGGLIDLGIAVTDAKEHVSGLRQLLRNLRGRLEALGAESENVARIVIEGSKGKVAAIHIAISRRVVAQRRFLIQGGIGTLEREGMAEAPQVKAAEFERC